MVYRRWFTNTGRGLTVDYWWSCIMPMRHHQAIASGNAVAKCTHKMRLNNGPVTRQSALVLNAREVFRNVATQKQGMHDFPCTIVITCPSIAGDSATSKRTTLLQAYKACNKLPAACCVSEVNCIGFLTKLCLYKMIPHTRPVHPCVHGYTNLHQRRKR